MSKPDWKGALHQFDSAAAGVRVPQARYGIEHIDASHRNPQVCQRLANLQADHTKTNHRDCIGQVFLLKNRITGENALTKIHPGRRHCRARAAGDHNTGSTDRVLAHLQYAWLNKAGITIDELVTHLVGGMAQHPVNQNIAHVANVFQSIRQRC